MEFSSLNEVASERQDVTVLGIMSYGSRDEAIQTQRNLALTFSLVSDPDGKIYDALRAPATPWKVITASHLVHAPLNGASDGRVILVPLQQDLYSDFSSAFLVLCCAVGAVLLIACANVANLLLARASARRKEIALRSALGASQARLIRQLFAENSCLALGAGLVGLILAKSVISMLKLAPSGIMDLRRLETDSHVLVFTFAVAALTVVLFGFAPALAVSKLRLSEELKGLHSRPSVNWVGLHIRVRRAIAVAEIALALGLLATATLLIKALWGLTRTDLNASTLQNVLTLRLTTPGWRYGTPQAQAAFCAAVSEQLKEIPGVTYVGVSSELPLSGEKMETPFVARGATIPTGEGLADSMLVSPDFFTALGIPLQAGRFFQDSDDHTGPPVAIIDDVTGWQLWGKENPLGKQIAVEGSPEKPSWRTIVGVVKHTKHSLAEAVPQLTIYLPTSQAGFPLSPVTVFLKLDERHAVPLSAIQHAIWTIDKGQPITNVQTLGDLVSALTSDERFSAELLVAFAAIAFLLAGTGVYGVISSIVSQRMHEFGVRFALGARPVEILCLVIRDGATLVVWGVALGLAGIAAASRLLSAMLYGVKPADALLLFGTVLALIAVVGLASYVPARRASQVDPCVILRYE